MYPNGTWNDLPDFDNQFYVLEIDNFSPTYSIIDLLWSTGDTTNSITVNPSQNTTYYLTQNINGVSCVDSINIIVIE